VPPSLASPVLGRRLWRRGPARAPLVAVRASSGGRRKDGPGGGGDGEEASSGKTLSSGYCLSRIAIGSRKEGESSDNFHMEYRL
jgi:hypothetical protein